jgi:hypothetical protein
LIVIYELRTYWAAPGKQAALHNRFRTLTLDLFARHNMHVVGFWVPEPVTEESGDLVYMMAYPDQAALDASWAAFRADPDWVAGKAASEVDGLLTRKATSTILQPTDYSPLK